MTEAQLALQQVSCCNADVRQALRFTLALIAGLALLTWGASVVVSRTTRAWFEKDMQLRAQLAVSGARETLVVPLGPGPGGGAAQGPGRAHPRRAGHGRGGLRRGSRAAGADGRLPAAALLRERLGPHVRPDAGRRRPSPGRPGRRCSRCPGAGARHRDPRPRRTSEALGFVVLVHDLSFVERREATTRRFLLLAFGFLALAASVDHGRRGPPVVARLEQRAAPAAQGRAAARPSSGRSCATCATWSSAWPPSARRTAWGACGRRSGSRTRSAATCTASAS